MAKLMVIALCCLAVCVQLNYARDLAEALDNDIRERLKGYYKFQQEDDGSHKADLAKLIEVTESALKVTGVDEKQVILKNIIQQFTPEFNKYIGEKLEEYQVNDDIQNSIEFYKSLLAGKAEFKDETEKTIATLETLLKNSNLQEKEAKYLSLNKDFTPEFQKFLAESSLPSVNRELQKTAEFLENLLVENNIKFQAEIKDLKAKADAALADLPLEQKQAELYQITNPPNPELYEFLQKKFIEQN